ncbi:VapC toxin family PIN domain ribonuclease [Marispirochaeta aestuarii]|uniref:VapC toxin family PIN domain ribonuclease n=1 Tax=Marispirochaeta aestuarii TaxID=1963862 RepID=A0A1Y1RTW1_9SPIO|nr:type II toxin-antitoxin system VapC family toxin [Marispirochaeta aestuarii]ORC28818.1 VapC toxin family PIN domain ribonuclease [Marispirochaeta aestuarii]
MSYLIDTDILIYSIKGNEKVNEKFQIQKNEPKSLSVITYGELVFGAKKSSKIEKNLARVRRISELFPIIDVTPAIMETYGEYKALLSKTGIVIDDMNLLIASTAITHNLILVTNNVRHFRRIKELEIDNWST